MLFVKLCGVTATSCPQQFWRAVYQSADSLAHNQEGGGSSPPRATCFSFVWHGAADGGSCPKANVVRYHARLQFQPVTVRHDFRGDRLCARTHPSLLLQNSPRVQRMQQRASAHSLLSVSPKPCLLCFLPSVGYELRELGGGGRNNGQSFRWLPFVFGIYRV